MFTSINQTDVSKGESKQVGAVRHTRELSKHLQAMFKQAYKECATRKKEDQLANLLTLYKVVFSKKRPRRWKLQCPNSRKKPDPSGNLHVDLDHIRSRRRSARCKTF